MIYKKFKGMEISSLGFGTMRFPVTGAAPGQIDEDAVREMTACAMEQGINYYDTAWGYHDGQSETVIGRVLSDYPRESFYLADKFPGYDPENISREKIPEIFERQLEKCGVGYFDFYLFHNVNSMNLERYLDDEGNGFYSYLSEQKKNGRIRHLGFSVHGDAEVTKRFLEAYGEEMEFAQIQLNWIDYEFQEAKRKLELLKEYGIPVWVMEPLRGGRLAQVPGKYAEKLKALRPKETVPGWGFRFIQSIPQVVVTLSGMSDLGQMKDNIDIFSSERPLDGREWEDLMKLAEEMTKEMTVPCTSCRYCTGYCPKELDIPMLLGLYNDNALTGRKLEFPPWALADTPEEKLPTACIGCRSCEGVCPQGIEISQIMRAFAEAIA